MPDRDEFEPAAEGTEGEATPAAESPPEPTVERTAEPEESHDPVRERRAALVGVRVAVGAVGVAAALAVVATVGLLPLPHVGEEPTGLRVVPAPPAQSRVCPGGLLRLGDEAGGNAGTPVGVGSAQAISAATGAEVQTGAVAEPGAQVDDTAAPQVLTVPSGDDVALAGAQAQLADSRDVTGLAASACLEPGGSAWLVGGATTVGRTTLLALVNPGEVAASVALRLLGAEGEISAPGMSGIDLPAGSRRVVSLAGLAADVASPVVQVTARGGRVVATLQHSIVRGLDAGGSELVAPAAEPATDLVIPGVRIVASRAVSGVQGLPDWQDIGAALRLAVPGEAPAAVTVTVLPERVDADPGPTTFALEVSGGSTVDVPLGSGLGAEELSALPDGGYTVLVESDVPVVAAVRASTVAGSDDVDVDDGVVVGSPASDLAWFSAAAPLTDDVLVTVAPGPDPELAIANPTGDAATVELATLDGGTRSVDVPAGGAARIPVDAGGSYRLTGAEGLSASVGFAGSGVLAAYPVVAPRPLAAPIVVHP